jgi:hypothetical protein
MATESEVLTSSTRILCALLVSTGRTDVPDWAIRRAVEATRKLQALLEQEQ